MRRVRNVKRGTSMVSRNDSVGTASDRALDYDFIGE